jgi:hypothetical protein
MFSKLHFCAYISVYNCGTWFPIPIEWQKLRIFEIGVLKRGNGSKKKGITRR